jgi:predicted nucleotide-binding protein (sugar kinase/HSP70/actin superfamily)
VALRISSFKCGHDAPTYDVIEGITEQSGTPYFWFKDLDENKPSGSIKIRVETIDYFLRRYREGVIRKRTAAEDVWGSTGGIGSRTVAVRWHPGHFN